MFKHHLKIAFRNLRKYKTQNIISVIGLAIGFVCFAFSALWLRHEMSFDNFHQNSDRIYRVHTMPFKWQPGAANTFEVTNSPYPLAEFLKSNFPEIEEAGVMTRTGLRLGEGDRWIPILAIDNGINNIFRLGLPQDFFLEGGHSTPPIAVIPELDNDEIRELLLELEHSRREVVATVPRWQPNTNIGFDGIVPIRTIVPPVWLEWVRMFETHTGAVPMLNRHFDVFVKVHDNVNMRALEERLDRIDVPEMQNPISMVFTPITQLRYNDPSGMTQMQSEVQFTHIRIFALAGLMVILCSLFNHLTLFVTRVRMRLRELALRKVNGASGWQIATTLITDFMLVVFFALLLGVILMALLLPTFREYANIVTDDVKIYTELAVYAGLLTVFGFIAGLIPSLFFQRKNLNNYIKGGSTVGARNTFRKISLFIQLVISLVMIFCAVVFIKQIRFLHETDLGFNRENVAIVQMGRRQMLMEYADRIQQIPGVVDAIPANWGMFQPTHIGTHPHYFTDSLGNTIEYNLNILIVDNRFFDFFGVQIIEGTNHNNDPTGGQYLLNETAWRDLRGLESQQDETRVGVFRDFHLSPTERARPTKAHFAWGDNPQGSFWMTVYRYLPGMREQTERAVRDWLISEHPDLEDSMIFVHYLEEVFERNFQSERALLRLLSIMTLVCVLIAIFGVYSLTSLTVQQRRKEIAIRKVHGAEVLDILNIFFKENLILFGVSAAVAFPAGYIIMRRWLEGYVRQVPIEAWLYVAIFLIVFAVIVLSIISIVWKAANQNPAKVVKSD